jgi:hypothetical protein
MSIAQLEAAVGIDLLPSLSQRRKEAMLRVRHERKTSEVRTVCQ